VSSTLVSEPDLDIFSPPVYARGMPYEAFAWLRAHAPVSWQPEPAIGDWPAGPGFWAITRHTDVAHVSKTPEVFSANLGATQIRDPDPVDLPFIRRMMLNMDPPEHSRLRKILNKGFTPRTIAQMEDVVRGYARSVLDEVAGRGECDFADEVGADFPLLVLAEVMGVPKSDRYLLYDWTNRIIGYQDTEYADAPTDPETGEPINPRSPRALGDMFAYARELAEHKRANPGDDIVSKLLAAEVDGERITDDEFQNMFFLFTVAGNDTTHSAIPGGLYTLLSHPEQHAALMADWDLLPGAIEEMLRYAPPVIHFRRTAACDTELAGQPIAAGDKVVVFYASANRDEAVFEAPDTFDITRGDNPHLTFGIGPHFCLGNSLARLQMRVMFDELFTRLPDIELAGTPERLQSNFINGYKHMPVRFTRQRS
jgi:cytochrome P450